MTLESDGGNRSSLPVPSGQSVSTQFEPHEYRAQCVDLPKESVQTTPRSSLLRGPTPESLAKAAETLAFKRDLLEEDVLLLRERGMVPLAIADEVGISLRWTVKILQEAGLEIPRYLTTSKAPSKSPDDVCELRRRLG